MKNKIAVIGAGSFGTSLAMTLISKGHEVSIWGRKKSQMALMRDTLENPHYLPGIRLPKELNIVGKEITPFLWGKIKDITGGASLEANIKLVLNNCDIAAKVAKEFNNL